MTSLDKLTSTFAGAYTTARSFQRRNVFEFETHVKRTADSARLMMDEDVSTGKLLQSAITQYKCARQDELLRPVMVDSMRIAIRDLLQQQHGARWQEHLTVQARETSSEMNAGEVKLTSVLVWGSGVQAAVHALLPLLQEPLSWATGEPCASRDEVCAHLLSQSTLLVTHAIPLPSRRAPPVIVHVGGAPRHNAAAKDSEWVRQRVSLEAAKPAHVEEMLLMDEGSGAVLEGTQTNFFAILPSGVVQTAGEGVLHGTVRRIVLEVCAQEGIQVQLEAPTISEAHTWQSAFLSSTSRLVLPLDQVHYRDTRGGREGMQQQILDTAQGSVVRRIEEGVRQAVASHSVDVFA